MIAWLGAVVRDRAPRRVVVEALGGLRDVIPALLLILLALLALLLKPDPAAVQGGPTRYVNRGDPTCGGHTPCYPTIQAAVNAVLPGETIVIQPGTYPEQVSISGKNAAASASEADRIIVMADPTAPPGSVVITGGTSACTNGHAIRLQQSKYITLRGLTIARAGGQAIALLGGNNQNQAIHVERNRIFDNGGPECNGGITVNRGNPGTLIVNNLIHGNGRNGVAFLDADGGPHYVVQNTIHGNAWSGVTVARSHEVFLVNNLITGNGVNTGATGGRFGVTREGSSAPQPSGIRLWNNLVCGNRLGEIDGPALDGTDTGNLTPTGSEGPGVGASPGCQSVATVYARLVGSDGVEGTADDDFALAPSSPAVDRGTDPRTLGPAGALFEADFAGAAVRPRPGTATGPAQFDVGAIEFAVPDAQGPTVTILGPGAGAVVRQSVTVQAQATDTASGVASLSLTIDGQPIAATLAPLPPTTSVTATGTWNTTLTADGAHTLSGTATDRAGNPTTATRVVTVDNTPPDTQITIGPSGAIQDTGVTFTYTGADNLTPTPNLGFAWRLDGGPFSAFSPSTSASIDGLTEGLHTFEVKARDLAGNEDPTPATRGFTVALAPAVLALDPSSGPVGTLVTVSGQNFETGATQVTFDGRPAVVRSVTPTSLTAVVPVDAQSGPVTVTTPRGSGVSAQPFVVTTTQDFALHAVPAGLQLLPGTSAAYTIALSDSSGPLTGFATLSVNGLPAGVTAALLPAATITGGQSRTLAVTAASSAAPAVTSVTVTATATVDGVRLSRSVAVALAVVAGGRTAALGRITVADGTPIGGVRLTLAAATASTDAAGNFQLVDVPAGQQMLGIDANAAQPGLPIYGIEVTLVAGQATQLAPLRITPPPPAERFVPIANAATAQVVSDERFPGASITIPAGVTITGWDGSLKTRIALERLSPDALPVPPPPGPTRSLYQVYFGTPMGGLPSAPLPVTVPNDQDLEPGEKAEIWYYDAAPIPGVPAGWRFAGLGTASADGRQVVSDPGVGISRFCGVCGVFCIIRNTSAQPNVNPRGPKAGEPVDLGTGLMVVDKTDLILPGRMSAVLRRSYNPHDPFGRIAGFELATGPGWTLTIDVVLLRESASLRRLVMPGNARFTFVAQADGTFTNTTSPDFAGAVLTPQPDGGHVLRFKDGGTWRFATGYLPRTGAVPLTGLNLLVAQSDRHGNTLTVARDTFGAPTHVTEPGGRVLRFTTDSLVPGTVRLLSVTDPIGRVARYGYTATPPFRLETVTDPAGGVTQYTYEVSGGIASITDPRGITFLTNEHDALGRVTRQTQADGGVWTFAYMGPPGAHTTASVTDPRGHTTVHRLDNAGFVTEQVDALGRVTRHQRDVGGRVTSTTDALGRITRFTYDAAGNLTRLTDPAGHLRTFTYESAFNRLTSSTDPLGQVTRFEHDTAGNLTAVVDPLGHRTIFTYNQFGQPLTVTDPVGNVTRLEYDAVGNLTATMNPLGERTLREYDDVSRLTRQINALGQTTTLGYDVLNRLETVLDGLAGVTRFGHDANGNLLTITDPRGSVTRHTYDAMDRLATRTDPVGATESFVHDALGNQVRHTDRKGQTATFVYDALNRRIQGSYADATVDLAYDTGGRLIQATDSTSGTLLNRFDMLDRLVAQTTDLGVLTYGYDAAGRRITMTAPAQPPVAYGYDAASHLTSITQANQLVQLQHDPAGRRTRLTLPNGVSTDYEYDAASRLTALRYRSATGPLGDLTYDYDSAGNRTTVAGSFARTLLPPPVTTATYDPANRQLKFGDLTMTYDRNGNLTSLVGPNDQSSFAWDSRNRLRELNPLMVAGEGILYDPLGRRIVKTTNVGTTSRYVYDGLDVVEEQSDISSITYLRSLQMDELLVRAGTDFYLSDALGSAIAIVGNGGTVTTSYSYSPFGLTSVAGLSPTNPFAHTGRDMTASGLYDHRARYYDPAMQRFISEDPLPPHFRALNELNAYAYAANNPLLFTDPLGMASIPGTRYCGPGGSGPVAGQVDRCCFDHDNCFDRLGIDAAMNLLGPPQSVWECRDRCDEELCRCLARTVPHDRRERVARSFVRWQFGCAANGQIKGLPALGVSP